MPQSAPTIRLNDRAARRCASLVADAGRLRIASSKCPSGATLVDCGLESPGGLEAGIMLAEICCADLARVRIVPSRQDVWDGPAVQVTTDHPLAACMASQYAGWQVAGDDFFAMGSGPMRAAAGREELFQRIGHRESPQCAVGVLETRQFPPPAVCGDLADKCGVPPAGLTLLLAPTASQAGTVQVVARTVETALHKLDTLGFDLSRVESGWGIAPLPPVAAGDLEAIGRTNDAVLYGGEVLLWVRGDDPSLESIGPKVPSSASPDHGRPFAEVFAAFDRDFYKIDPHLFSPAVVTFCNLDTGRTFHFGQRLPRVIHESFFHDGISPAFRENGVSPFVV